jgi:hypothetical protein
MPTTKPLGEATLERTAMFFKGSSRQLAGERKQGLERSISHRARFLQSTPWILD